MLARKSFVEVIHSSFNDELAPTRHGITRVHGKIEHDPIEVPRIRLN